jgi:ubiquitin carboxyl-terminal hydrolase 7
MHMDPEHVRLWGIVRRQNKTIRPDEPITDLKEMFSDLDKRFNASSNGVLRVWAEVIGPDTVHCHPTRAYSLEDGYILIFLKHFSVETQSLRGVCHIYVTGTMRTKELVPIITDLMGWGEEPPDDEELVIWEVRALSFAVLLE